MALKDLILVGVLLVVGIFVATGTAIGSRFFSGDTTTQSVDEPATEPRDTQTSYREAQVEAEKSRTTRLGTTDSLKLVEDSLGNVTVEEEPMTSGGHIL